MSAYHEPESELQQKDRDFHRALNSLKEEIEAVDWYHQRIATTQDDTLKTLLEHNRDEEIEHACMVIEWLRRNMPVWDEQLRTYLFTGLPITEVEAAGTQEGEEAGVSLSDGSLNIGDLK